MSAGKSARTEGWYFPYYARKWHYFLHGRSLCGRWFGKHVSYLVLHFESPTNCTVCQRKYQKGMAAKPVGAEELGT